MKAVVLAGGGGTRLWPLSRRAWPKQFLRIRSSFSLFQGTIKRLLNFFSPEDILIVTGKEYEFIVHWELKELKVGTFPHIICEPQGRGTAPAVALSLKYLLERLGVSPSESVLVLPSDHIIEPEEAFTDAVKLACNFSLLGRVLTFGIKPYRPETGYGYIGVLREIEPRVFEVEGFFEKPTLSKAKEFLASGRYFWNSGIFLFRIDTMMEEMERYAHSIAKLLKLPFDEMLGRFTEMPNISIDYAVMEKTKKMLMVSLEAFWSDVGSYDAIYEVLDKDEHGNVLEGEVINLSSKNNMVFGDKRLIVTLGVEDLLVVETEDAVLIAKRGESQRVKDVVNILRERSRREADERVTVYRPWGMYTLLKEEEGYRVRRVVINPGEKLTFQRHALRSEHWVVVKGEAKVTLEDKEVFLKEGESLFVPPNTFHRLENPSSIPLEIIEVSCGSYLGEDDIERRDV